MALKLVYTVRIGTKKWETVKKVFSALPAKKGVMVG